MWVGGEIFRSQTHLTTLAKMGYLESAICSDLSILSFDLIGSDLLSFFNSFFDVKSISRDLSGQVPGVRSRDLATPQIKPYESAARLVQDSFRV